MLELHYGKERLSTKEFIYYAPASSSRTSLVGIWLVLFLELRSFVLFHLRPSIVLMWAQDTDHKRIL